MKLSNKIFAGHRGGSDYGLGFLQIVHHKEYSNLTNSNTGSESLLSDFERQLTLYI